MPFFKDLDLSLFRDWTVIVDIDGTLVADGENDPDAITETVLRRLASVNKVYLCSNKANSQRNLGLAHRLGVEYLNIPQRKPFSRVDIPTFTPGRLMVIGDRFITDGLWARRIGGSFTKVDHLRTRRVAMTQILIDLLDDALWHLFGVVSDRNAVLTILTAPPKTWSNLPNRVIDGLKVATKSTLFFLSRIPRFCSYTGPQAVLQSLKRGLDLCEVKYVVNPWINKVSDTVHVISDISALRWAIAAKRVGKIKRLLAGPNLVVAPPEKGGILVSKEIDIILVPSAWVKDFYCSFRPDLAERIKIWAAGVDIPAKPETIARSQWLIYKKSVPESLYSKVCDVFRLKQISFDTISYGTYRQQDYFTKLKNAAAMVYLAEHESQGIALAEAWAHNVPTLIWNRGYMRWRQYQWHDRKVSAPYLAPACGRFFRDAEEFPEALDKFISDLPKFSPREYALENFSDKVSAEKYLKILKSA